MNLIRLCFLSLLTMVLTACGGEGSGLPSQGGGGGETVPAIVSLQVTPATATIPVGFGQQYLALATLDDDSVMDVTTNPTIHWSTSNPSIATIDNTGLATGLTPGEVIITASGIYQGKPFERAVKLTITNAIVTSLQVTPTTTTIPVAQRQQFTALVTLSDGSIIDVTNQSALTWSSDDSEVATIENSRAKKGQAIGVTPGITTITASATTAGKTFSASAELTVSDAVITKLRVEPETVNIPVGLSLQFHAIATYSDGHELDVTDQEIVNWSSSNSGIATIDNATDKGLTTGVMPGDIFVTASGTMNGTPFSETSTLKVTNAIAQGLTVTPSNSEVPIGFRRQFNAILSLSDGTYLDVTNNTALNWSSNDPAIATIENDRGRKGQATGLVEGIVTIKASGKANGRPFSSSAQLTVNEPQLTSIIITPDISTIVKNGVQKYTATSKFDNGSELDTSTSVFWTSSNPNIASMDASGLASGNSVGTTEIYANKDGVTSNTASLNVVDFSNVTMDIPASDADNTINQMDVVLNNGIPVKIKYSGMQLGDSISLNFKSELGDFIFDPQFNNDETVNDTITTKNIEDGFIELLMPPVAFQCLNNVQSNFTATIASPLGTLETKKYVMVDVYVATIPPGCSATPLP